MKAPPSQTVFFQPAPGDNYGAAAMMNGEASAMVSKTSFTKGVALTHAGLLFSIFIPPIMLCIQMANNADLQYFVGVWAAQLAYFLAFLIVLTPMMHFVVKFTPWMFLMSVWVPGGMFGAIGWYYWTHTYTTIASLQSTDCVHFPVKAELQRSYAQTQDLYNGCTKFVTNTIEECPAFHNLFDTNPADFTYLKGLEHRFQCAGVCNSAVRVWQSPGTSAPACSLFIAEWVRGAESSAQFVLWYSVIVVLASIPVFITLLDTFFQDFYKPVMAK